MKSLTVGMLVFLSVFSALAQEAVLPGPSSNVIDCSKSPCLSIKDSTPPYFVGISWPVGFI